MTSGAALRECVPHGVADQVFVGRMRSSTRSPLFTRNSQIQQYRERPQLLGIHGAAWLIIRRKQAAREAFQRGPPTCGAGAAVGGGRGGGNGDDYEDLESDEDSPPSGADAGGGQADSVLPAREWEVKASSPNFTLAQVDHDRCARAYASDR